MGGTLIHFKSTGPNLGPTSELLFYAEGLCEGTQLAYFHREVQKKVVFKYEEEGWQQSDYMAKHQ